MDFSRNLRRRWRKEMKILVFRSLNHSATGCVKDLRIDGLSNYRVKRVDSPMTGFKAKVILLFREIKIETRYKMQGTFLDENSFHGHGKLDLRIKKLKATTDLQLEIRQGRLYVSNLELQTRVRKFDCHVSRLYVNDNLSEDISHLRGGTQFPRGVSKSNIAIC